jgi:hypothetical protein
MNDTWQRNAYGTADGRFGVDGANGTASPWPAEVVEGLAAAALTGAPSRPAAAPVRPAIPPPAHRRSSDGAEPLRLVQVYLTPVIDEFLRQARSMAIMQGLDVSASAIVRHAMEQLLAAVSPAEMVALLGSPKGQSYRKRGRPRRLMPALCANFYMHNSEKCHALL